MASPLFTFHCSPKTNCYVTNQLHSREQRSRNQRIKEEKLQRIRTRRGGYRLRRTASPYTNQIGQRPC